MTDMVAIAPGLTAGKPPEWDVERFLRGDELDTALITLERNRRTFAWKCDGIGAEAMALRLAPSPRSGSARCTDPEPHSPRHCRTVTSISPPMAG
jgi:hypothetical protein